MNSSWSVTLYRFLMQAYPAEFRNHYGEPVDQAFRDMHRDAVQQRGYLGVALLWFHIVPDFLFSAGEVLLSKAGDFLKWRFRLQWVVACSLGFALARSIFFLPQLRELFTALARGGSFLSVLNGAVATAIFMLSLGFMQSRVLSGRCFRKKQWVLYGLAGAILASIVFQPLFVSAGILVRLQQLLRNLPFALQDGLIEVALNNVIGGIPGVFWGALTGALQSAAVKNDAITRYRWVKACIAGYFLSGVAGGFAIPYAFDSALQFVVMSVVISFVAGAILGLLTSGPLEEILFSVQADSKERP